MSSSGPDQSPLSSPANDLRKLKASSSAAAQELTDWLARMRGKSPREVLGEVASSHLMRSLIQAAIGIAVFILLFTVIPWSVSLFRGGTEKAAEVTAADAASAEGGGSETSGVADPESTATGGDPEQEPPPADAGTPASPDIDLGDKAAIADQLGVGETKEAPANVNPLDGAVDDLLEGLE